MSIKNCGTCRYDKGVVTGPGTPCHGCGATAHFPSWAPDAETAALLNAGVPRNALGVPSPNRTDFSQWQRSTLEQFARQAADENLVLRDKLARIKELVTG
jgi:hypothetical protein